MTTSFRRDKSGNRKKKLLVIFLALCVIVLFSRIDTIAAPMSRLASIVGSPLLAIRGGIVSAGENFLSYFLSKSRLSEENRRLKESLYASANRSYQIDILSRENAEMRRFLEREEGEGPFALSNVLAHPPISAFDTLIIDLGTDDGVEIGMTVHADDTFAIGRIVETYSRTSLVSLFSTNGNELETFVGASSSPVTMRGVGGGAFRASVPKGTEIAAGDPVLVAGYRNRYLGVVGSVDISDESSLVMIHASLPVNLYHLRHVYIDLSSNK
jgi:cell shape-determining protein MreC